MFPSQKAPYRVWILFFLSLFCGSASALTTQDGSCTISGDSDVYGLGIRLGLYLQWLSVFLATFFDKEGMGNVRATTNIICIAVFVNTFRGAARDDDLVVLEWYIVYWLTFFLFFGNVPLRWQDLEEGARGLGAFFLIEGGLILAQPWLYFKAYWKGYRPECTVYILFYAAFDAYDRKWLTALKVLSCIGVIAGVVFVVLGVAMIWFGISFNPDEWDAESYAKLKVKAKKYGGWFWPGLVRGIMISSAAFGIAFIERIIVINHIQGVYTLDNSGQLIPFVIGICSVLTVLSSGLRKILN